MNVQDHFRLSASQQTILLYLSAVGGVASAAECVRRARGVYGYLNDLRFLDYVAWDDPLLRSTVVRLTPAGDDFLRWQFPTAPDDFDQCAQVVIPMFRGRQPAFDPNYVFVLMPFEDQAHLPEVYKDHVKLTLEERGFAVERADNVYGTGDVMAQIWSGISRAGVVVADFTGRNPNVFYEVGLCHALGKRVILLSQNINDVPFDLRSLRVIVYEYTPKGARDLEKRLLATVEHEVGSASQRVNDYQAIFAVPGESTLRPLIVRVRGRSEADAFDHALEALGTQFAESDPTISSRAALLAIVPAETTCFIRGDS